MSTDGENTQHTISLEIDPSVLTVSGFIKIEEAFLDLLRAVSDEAVSQLHLANGEWIIEAVREGSIVLETRHNKAPEIAGFVSSGLERLADPGADPPALFNDRALAATSDLFDQLRSHVNSAKVCHADFATMIDRELAEKAEATRGPEVTDIGAVEGRLEGLNVHDRRRFTIYDSLTGRPVICNFGSRIPLEEVTAAVTKRVAVQGVLRYRGSGELLSVRAHSLNVFRPDSELPTADEASTAFLGR